MRRVDRSLVLGFPLAAVPFLLAIAFLVQGDLRPPSPSSPVLLAEGTAPGLPPSAPGIAEPPEPRREPIVARGRILAGRLINPSGKPVRNWRILIRPDPPFDEKDRPRLPVVETVTGADGEFQASGVASGPLSIRIDRGDPLPPVIRRIARAAEGVEVVFGSPTTIAGRVKDARSGAPIRAFTVIGYGDEDGEARWLSRGRRSRPPRRVTPIRSKDGSFRVADLHAYGEGVWFEAIASFATSRSDVVAAWVFGSRAFDGGTSLSDLDVAFLLDAPRGTDLFSRGLALRSDLAETLGTNALDVVVLNDAPVDLRYAAVRRGRLVVCRNELSRVRFEVDTTIRWIDMEPFRRTLARGLQRRLEEGTFGR